MVAYVISLDVCFIQKCRQSSGRMPTAVRPTKDDRVGWMAESAATRRPWSNFGHYTIDDWPSESVVPPAARTCVKQVGTRPCTVGGPSTTRHSTFGRRRPISTADGMDNRGPRLRHHVGTPEFDDGPDSDDMLNGTLSDDSSDGGPAKETPETQKTADIVNSGAFSQRRSIGKTLDTQSVNSEGRSVGQTPVQRPHSSRETESICMRDIDDEIQSLWDIGSATKKTMSAMMYLNNGLTLPSPHKRVSLAQTNRRMKSPVSQGFSKTTRRKAKPKLPTFYIKPQHRHTSANVFLATRYAALQRSTNNGCITPDDVVVDASANSKVAFSKMAKTQILRRLQERNQIKVETKRKMIESSQMQAKVDAFIKSLAKFVPTQ